MKPTVDKTKKRLPVKPPIHFFLQPKLDDNRSYAEQLPGGAKSMQPFCGAPIPHTDAACVASYEERLPTLRSCAARIACIFHANRSLVTFPLWFVLNVFSVLRKCSVPATTNRTCNKLSGFSVLRKCSVPATTNRTCNKLSGPPLSTRRQPGRI